MNKFKLSTIFMLLFAVVSGSYFILPGLLISSPAIFTATDYYVNATNGSDSNNCRSSATACQTLAKLTTITLNAGDHVYLKRGETWRETLVPVGSGSSGNPITFDAYGRGARPIITGEDFINGPWVNSSGNEYKISMAAEPYILYENGSIISGNIINDIEAPGWTLHSGNTYKARHYSPSAPAGVFDHYNGVWNKLVQGSSKNTLAAGQYFWEDGALAYLYVRANNNVDLANAPHGYVYTTTVYKGALTQNSWFYDRTAQELYVRLLDNTQPQTNEVGYSARDYNISLTDQSYYTFNNISLEKSKTMSIHSGNTRNQSGFIFENMDIFNYGISAIRFDGLGLTFNGVTVRDVNIVNGPMQAWVYPISRTDANAIWSAIQLGDGEAGPMPSFSNILIKRVSINGGSRGSGNARSNGRDAIAVMKPHGYIVEETEVTGVDHGIYARGDDLVDSCSGIIFRYNYVHDLADDALWGSACNNLDKTEIMLYGNVIKNSGDVCFGFSSSNYYLANNTCVGFWQAGWGTYGTPRAPDNTVINNIIVKTDTAPCNGTIHCMGSSIYLSYDEIDNNVYYDVAGTTGGLLFTDNETPKTFAQWQASAGTPDAIGLNVYDPYFGSNAIGYSVNANVGTHQGNNSICAYGIRLLHKDSVWPDNVITVSPCPENYLDKVDIGAYRVSG